MQRVYLLIRQRLNARLIELSTIPPVRRHPIPANHARHTRSHEKKKPKRDKKNGVPNFLKTFRHVKGSSSHYDARRCYLSARTLSLSHLVSLGVTNTRKGWRGGKKERSILFTQERNMEGYLASKVLFELF